ncbi:MAG: lysylphosphatidylglycerol synthase domain-containing protein [Pseudomonadota bacterium]|nr:lysylphosphatidylglycerol synthase domain-containing protein [Pseudomonadota bacterium]
MTENNKVLLAVTKLLKNRWFHIISGLGILVSILFYFRGVKGDFRDIVQLSNIFVGLIALPFVIYSLLAHAIAWRYIINHYGNKLGFWQSIYLYNFSNMSRYIPGNYWHFIYRSTIGVKFGIDVASGAKATGIEILINTIVGFIFVICGIVLKLIHLDQRQYYWLLFFLFISILIFLVFYFLDNKVKSSKKRDLAEDQSLLTKLKKELSQIWTFSFKEIIILVSLFSSAWISQGFTFFFVLSAWGGTPISNYIVIMFSYVTAWFLGFINPIAQNGLGVREAILLITLNQLFPASIILGAGIGMRVVGILGELFSILLGWLFGRGNKEKVN